MNKIKSSLLVTLVAILVQFLTTQPSHSQVLIGWDSVSATQIIGVTLPTGQLVAQSDAISYELGFWAPTVDTTSKATLLSSFTSWGTVNGKDYFGTVGELGLGSGLLGNSNDSAVIPTSWVGQSGTTVGIVFGRSTSIWGAFRFAAYPPAEGVGSVNILANSPAPAAPNQMDYFTLDLIGEGGTFAGAGSVQIGSYDLITFGDQDPGTPGDQYLQTTGVLSLVPEPSSSALLMIGAAGLVALRRLRKV